MKSKLWLVLVTMLIVTSASSHGNAAETKHGFVVTEHLASEKLREARNGLDVNRAVKIYLPPSYSTSDQRYPVIYYFHSINWSAEKMFADGNLARLLERGFANGVVPEFILVAAEYGSPMHACWYQNSPASGSWLDFTTDELVPFIDSRYRTIKHRDSRGLAGDFVGGRGALKLAMSHPDIFSVVYALHPVATGIGLTPMAAKVDWRKIHRAKAIIELEGDIFAWAFVSFHQAFLPNPTRPPFFCDFMMELENGEPKLHHENMKRLKVDFLLDGTLEQAAANLRSIRGIAFDWARYDPNQDHVYANQAFTKKLDDLGIEHEAEEYRGDPWNQNWTPHGRFYARVLPFFARHLVFNEGDSSKK